MKRGIAWLSVLGWVVCLCVLGAVVAGFFIVGGPAQARAERADQQRVSDLETLTRAIRQYYADNKALPTKQEKAYSKAYVSAQELMDPEMRAPYEYRVVDAKRFELCATFRTDQSKESHRTPYYYGNAALPFWKHKAGRQCFTMTAKE